MKLPYRNIFYKIQRRKMFTLFTFLSLISTVFYLLLILRNGYTMTYNCSVEDVHSAVKTVCDSYSKNLSLGNLCQSLCLTGELQPDYCIAHHSGKEVVFHAILKKKKVVVKALYLNAEKYDQVYWTDELKTKIYPDLEFFDKMLSESVKNNLNLSLKQIKTGKHLVDHLWTLTYSKFLSLDTNLQHTAMSNMWYLIQQPEYLLSKMFETKGVFPKIIGSCGHIFVVEYLKPLANYFSILHPSWKHNFEIRVKWALKILNLISKFETDFISRFHICDVKMGHFGLSINEEIKLLDLDMIFAEDTLKRNMAINTCNNDDCSFIHCKGTCDKKTGYCTESIINSNIQRVCENIFLGYAWKKIFGLLSLPPVNLSYNLQKLLESCMNGTENILQKLQNTLETSIIKTI